MRTRSLLPAAMVLCGCSLHHRPVAPEPPRAPARDSLFELDQSRTDSVARRGLADGLGALLDPNVVFLRAGLAAVYGADNVRAVFAAEAPPTSPSNSAGAIGTTWQPLGGGVSVDLHAGYTYGVVARTIPPKTQIRLERYVAFWRRASSAGSPWRITAYAEVGAPIPPIPEIALPATAFQPSVAILPKPLDVARARIREADSSFADLAYRMGVGFAFSNTAAPEGVVFGSPALIVGPTAIRDFYAERAETSLAWKPVYADVAPSADLGFTVGEYINTVRGPSGAAVQRFGKYLTIWKKQRDGSWKFLVDGGNPSPPPDAHRERN